MKKILLLIVLCLTYASTETNATIVTITPKKLYNDVVRNITVTSGQSISLNPRKDIGVITNFKQGGVTSSDYELSNKTAFNVSISKKSASYGYYNIYSLEALKTGTYTFTGIVYYYTETKAGVYHAWDIVSNKAIYNITVVDVTSIDIPSTLALSVGESYTFCPVVNDPRAQTTLSWSTSNPQVISVSNDGKVQAQSAGTANITCKASNGISKTCVVTVTPVKVSQVILPSANIELKKNSYYSLTPTILPANATNQEIVWSTSNSNVATITSMPTIKLTSLTGTIIVDGKTTSSSTTASATTVIIRAVEAGTAIITGFAADGSGTMVSCNVTVTDSQETQKTLVSSITLNSNLYQCLSVGQTYQLRSTIKPSDATDKSVTWTSNDNSVVTVDADGLVRAKGLGNTQVICSANDGSGVTATCAFDVLAINVSNIAISPTSCTLEQGSTKQLAVAVSPNNATNKGVVWVSSDTDIAQVNSNGEVMAVSPGTTTVICKALDGSNVQASSLVTVTPVIPHSIILSKSNLTLNGGEQHQLTANIIPSNAAINNSLSWSSSDPAVADIDNNGLITAKGFGQTTIKCSLQDGSDISATCEVTVEGTPITSIALNIKSYTFGASDNSTNKLQLRATVSPSDATNPHVTWGSSNDAVATVNEEGLVTAIGRGVATISCVSNDNSGVNTSCSITVKTIFPQSFATNVTSVNMLKNEDYQLNTLIVPANTTYYSLRWSSSNENVATVNESGLVTAVNSGSTIITCTLNMSLATYFPDPFEKKSTCIINVGLPDDMEETIQFSDETVKNLCLANWDVNSDGKLQKSEAAAISDIGEVFRGKSAITSFDEFQFFTALEVIPDDAFRDCTEMSSIVLPPNVTSIGSRSFRMCSKLTVLSIPERVESIGMCAFYGCDLDKVYIPQNVRSIGSSPFAINRNLSSIVVDSNNPTYSSKAQDGTECNIILEKATDNLIQGCITSTIPEGVKTIGVFAFGYSNITSIILPNSLTKIRGQAFDGCELLKEIELPGQLQLLEYLAFNDCQSLTSVNIPASVTFISSSVFEDCDNLKSITVSEDNHVYDSRNDCNAIIETATNKLVQGIQTTVIPDDITELDSECFRRQSYLTSIVLPESVTTIGSHSFAECIRLKEVIIPASVTSIGDHAFTECHNLKSVTCMAPNPPAIAELTFTSRKEAVLYVPAGSKTAYQEAAFWSEFGEFVEVLAPDTPNIPEVPSTSIEETNIDELTDVIYIRPVSGITNGDVEVEICLKNSQAVTAYNFDLELPEGVSIVTDKLSDRHDGHTRVFNIKDNNVYSFLAISFSSQELIGRDGAIRRVKLHISDDIAVGKFAIKIRNAMYATPSEEAIGLPTMTATLTVSNFRQGDANNNGQVDISDAVSIINHLVGKQSSSFAAKAADSNKNGLVDIGDAVTVVNFLVGKNSALSDNNTGE